MLCAVESNTTSGLFLIAVLHLSHFDHILSPLNFNAWLLMVIKVKQRAWKCLTGRSLCFQHGVCRAGCVCCDDPQLQQVTKTGLKRSLCCCGSHFELSWLQNWNSLKCTVRSVITVCEFHWNPSSGSWDNLQACTHTIPFYLHWGDINT